MMLTDTQCDEFRRMPGSFNDMVREIYAAGQESMRAKLDEQWNDGFDKGKVAGRKAGLEEAAKVCEGQARVEDVPLCDWRDEIAAAIRALIAD
jgi:hypothetical protein